MNAKIESTKHYLQSKGVHIQSSNIWLKNCVEWFVQENSMAPNQELQNFVYDQFLLADLRDIQLNCLPENISMKEKIYLSGQFTLQVDSIQDVSQSSYSQIQTIRGTGKNLNVDNQRNNLDPDQMKGDHMLKLNMTDGSQHIFGMEYEKLMSIRQGFIPGCKVVVIGPLECRLGVLFLKPNNFKFLGGELDSLIITNSVENVLARILNIDENPNALPMNQVNELLSTQETSTQQTLTNGVGSSHQTSRSSNQMSLQNTVQNMSNNRQPNMVHPPFQQPNSIPPTRQSLTDHWSDEEDMEVWQQLDTTLKNLAEGSVGNQVGENARNISNESRPHENMNNEGFLRPLELNSNHIQQHESRCNQALNSISNTSSHNVPSTSSTTNLETPSTFKRQHSPDLTTPPPKRNNFNSVNSNSTPVRSGDPGDSTLLSHFESSNISEISRPISKPNRMNLQRIQNSPPPLPFSMVFHNCRVISMEKLVILKCQWTLPAVISDNSANLTVIFNDNVIFNISGVPAAHLHSQRQKVKTDPEVKKTLAQMLIDIRAKIANYEGAMKISFTATQKPTVVALPNS